MLFGNVWGCIGGSLTMGREGVSERMGKVTFMEVLVFAVVKI